MVTIDFKIEKEDDRYIISFIKTATGIFDEQLADVTLKMYVNKQDLEHLRTVIDGVLLK